MEGSKIELEPHNLPRLMSDKRIYHFQIPRTTPTNDLKKVIFLVVYEVYEQIGSTFLVPEKTVIFLGSNLKM